jgi:hypothetical protein
MVKCRLSAVPPPSFSEEGKAGFGDSGVALLIAAAVHISNMDEIESQSRTAVT